MKLLLFFLFTFMITIQQIISQTIDTPTDNLSQGSYDDFRLKQKKQKTAAWVCLGGGIAMFAGGSAIALDNLFSDGNEGEALIYIGLATSIVSIPLFISAGKNKRKAALSLKEETVSFGNLTYKNSRHIAFALTIDF